MLIEAARRAEAAARETLAAVNRGTVSCAEMRKTLTVLKSAAAAISAAQTAAAESIAVRERHGDGGAQMLAAAAGLSQREARGQVKTAQTLRKVPALREAVESGQVPPANARHLAAAVNQAGAQAVQSDDGLLQAAATMRPEQFTREARRWRTEHDRDDGAGEYQRQRARRRLRIWDNHDDGMVHLHAEFDKVAGTRIANRLRRHARYLLDTDKRTPGTKQRSFDQCMADTLDNITNPNRTRTTAADTDHTNPTTGSSSAMGDRPTPDIGRRGTAGGHGRAQFQEVGVHAPDIVGRGTDHTNRTTTNRGRTTAADTDHTNRTTTNTTRTTAADTDHTNPTTGNSSAMGDRPTPDIGRRGTAGGHGRAQFQEAGVHAPDIGGRGTARVGYPTAGSCDDAVGDGVSSSARQPGADICVMVNVDDDTGNLIAQLPDRTRLPRSVLNALSCDAAITGVICDRQGSPIWRSYTSRGATQTQKQILFATYGGCLHCGANPTMCQIHHIEPVWNGGQTEINNLIPLCWQCHDLIHEHGWWILKRTLGKHTMHPPQGPHHGPARQPDHPTPYKNTKAPTTQPSSIKLNTPTLLDT